VHADSTLLKNAISNLLINAYQAMETEGQLNISIEKNESDQQAVIMIADTGSGIATDVLPKIFNPFFTTKDTGTGLGLALVRKIINGHGGNIDVESAVNEGTTFTVALPLVIENQFDDDERMKSTGQVIVKT